VPRVSGTLGSERLTATTLLPLTGSALPFHRCSLLTNLRLLASPLLAFDGLPPANLFQAFEVLAIPLLPVPRLVAAPAALSQADARAEPLNTRRRAR
jgi:hypothetical protein